VRAALFLDRDNTLTIDHGYTHRLEDLEFVPGAIDALRRVPAEVPIIVITNQSGVGRGFYPESVMHQFHARLTGRLAEAGVRIAAIRFCPHDPTQERCTCRKPGISLLVDAAKTLGLDLSRSVFIGDSAADMEAARRAGCLPVELPFRPGMPRAEASDAWSRAIRTALDALIRNKPFS